MRIVVRAAAGIVALMTCTVVLRAQSEKPREIKLGKPKVWRYDRVYPMLDGLYRDVEGVSLRALSDLDPNATNAHITDVLQTMASLGVSYDQVAGLRNQFAMRSANATLPGQLANAQTQTNSLQVLNDARSRLVQQYAAASLAQSRANASRPRGVQCKDDTTCAMASQTVTDLAAQISAVDGVIAAAPTTAVTQPDLTSVPPPDLPSGLPAGINASSIFAAALEAGKTSAIPSLPARERLANYVTLLNDRLTTQLALSLDERGLDSRYVPLLMEFDVALQPNESRAGQKAGSEFQIRVTDKLANCSALRPIVYNLYPALQALNVQSIEATSRGEALSGSFAGTALGASMEYQRQRDHLSQAMQQSVYIAGYRSDAAAETFGWYYSPPPYAPLPRSGMYTTYAVVLIPRDTTAGSGSAADPCDFSVEGRSFWQTAGAGRSFRRFFFLADDDGAPRFDQKNAVELIKPGERLGRSTSLSVTSVQYQPLRVTPTDVRTAVNVIAVQFDQPIDPNLLITVGGKLIKRVRDSRGRATSINDAITPVGASNTNATLSRALGLFEADIDDPDTWIAISQDRLLIKLSGASAGFSSFPDVRLLAAGRSQVSLTQLVNYRTYTSTVSIGDQNYFACHPKFGAAGWRNEGCMPQPSAMWLPLFSVEPEADHRLKAQPVNANGDAPDNSGLDTSHVARVVDTTFKQKYVYLTVDDGAMSLRSNAQVTLISPGHSRFARPRPIECAPLGNGLLCHFHPQTIVFNSGTEPGGGPRCLQFSRKDAVVKTVDTTSTNPLTVVTKGITVPSDTITVAYSPNVSLTDECDWKKYRLQLQVRQPANLDGSGALDLRADLPSWPKPKEFAPAMGSAVSLSRGKSDWSVTFPIWYDEQFRTGKSDGCLTDGIAQPVDVTLAGEAPAASDTARSRRLTVSGLNELTVFIRGMPTLWTGKCARPGIEIGSLVGVPRLFAPDAVRLTKTGSTKNLYHLTGRNLVRVDSIVGTGKKGARVIVAPGGLLFDASTIAGAQEQPLSYAIGGALLPVVACWDESRDLKTTTTKEAIVDPQTKKTTTPASKQEAPAGTMIDHFCGLVTIPAATPRKTQ